MMVFYFKDEKKVREIHKKLLEGEQIQISPDDLENYFLSSKPLGVVYIPPVVNVQIREIDQKKLESAKKDFKDLTKAQRKTIEALITLRGRGTIEEVSKITGRAYGREAAYLKRFYDEGLLDREYDKKRRKYVYILP